MPWFHLSLERVSEGGGEGDGDADTVEARPLYEPCGERCCVLYGGVLVTSGESLGYGESVAYFVNPGLDGPLVAFFVEYEASAARVRGTLDGGDDLFGASHLRDAFGVDEARRFDTRNAGRGQFVAKFGTDLRS